MIHGSSGRESAVAFPGGEVVSTDVGRLSREDHPMKCRKCGTSMAFGLELVRGGRVYECWRCSCSLEVVKVEETTELKSEWVREPGLLVVRLSCRNAYIFDRALFLKFVRAVARELKDEPRHLVLNLEGVSFLSEGFLPLIFRVRRFLRGHGKHVKIVQKSPLFRAFAALVDADVDEYMVADEGAGLRALPSEPQLAAIASV